MFNPFRKTWRAVTGRERWETGLEDELRSHIEHRADDLARRGLAPEEALRRARIELGARESYKEECRRSYGLRWLDETWQDLRYALRTLRRSPGFTAVAVLSLALGIGANTVVFGVLDALVLRPLPVKDPARLFFVEPMGHSYPAYLDYKNQNVTFSDLFAYRVTPLAIGSEDAASRAWGYLVTGNYFDALGVEPVLGRFFHAAEDTRPGAAPYAVLSYDYWRNRFDAGRGEQDCAIAGRLRPGASVAQAEANLRAIGNRLAREYPNTDSGRDIHLSQLGLFGESLRRPMEAFVFGVILLSGLVLLAACANLASLVAARGAGRGLELAIRVSIGAGRGRIARQLAAESLLLALAGGAAGCALAAMLLNALRHVALVEVPIRAGVAPNLAVVLYGLGAALLSALVFGVAPARQAFRASPNLALRSGAWQSHGGGWPLREGLLALQVALCCVLVTASFAAAIGAQRASRMPLAIRPQGVAVAGFDLALAKYPKERIVEIQRAALDAAARIPGVTAAGFGDAFPLGVDQNSNGVYRPDETDFRSARQITVSHFNVSPGYLAAIGARLVEGRDFNWRDGANAPRVAIVNAIFARKVLGTQHGVGMYFRLGPKTLVQVIGVTEDGKYRSIGEDPQPALFFPILQNQSGTTYLFARSSRPAAAVAGEMESVVRGLDRNLPLYSVGPLENLLDLAFFQARAAAWCLGAFGLLAVMLAVTGIYGLSAYTVSRRVREIGIRVAIGAQPRQVLRSALGRMAAIVALGAAAGIAGALASSIVLAHVVAQAAPSDPLVLGGVAATMITCALLSCLGPARRAISVDPIQSLRSE